MNIIRTNQEHLEKNTYKRTKTQTNEKRIKTHENVVGVCLYSLEGPLTRAALYISAYFKRLGLKTPQSYTIKSDTKEDLYRI